MKCPRARVDIFKREIKTRELEPTEKNVYHGLTGPISLPPHNPVSIRFQEMVSWRLRSAVIGFFLLVSSTSGSSAASIPSAPTPDATRESPTGEPHRDRALSTETPTPEPSRDGGSTPEVLHVVTGPVRPRDRDPILERLAEILAETHSLHQLLTPGTGPREDEDEVFARALAAAEIAIGSVADRVMWKATLSCMLVVTSLVFAGVALWVIVARHGHFRVIPHERSRDWSPGL
ncbi:ORF8 [Ictalurid herpesvirus 1]|uniref:Putative membrane protein ORF8 n=1 Tax=Ictalurid herpesvirus 1 (strain Auburn) TaxID=766178 RepID=VG08_ICHVA|nr:ORF8 [Ictalurid herpesvirus 1]NP_041177.1 ORF8 [Ictalurid herpesvirus 1]Q00137.1 RecName: Full=Putative membrane protein ORF8 [Ictalurid herpesvirus 1 (strain Auburn)]AAA88111.1 ORF8 [Ictalurid herpesvirus 1]AAA88189.1 ORF8 [Ictalurid herpesvirus 1]